MENGFPKYQYSEFVGDGQYVVRSNDKAEFKIMVAEVKLAVAASPKIQKASQTQNSAPTSDSKPKVPYMHVGEKCPVCGQGTLQKTIKESKAGEKYNALVCDQQGCSGFAYISKYPRKFPMTATPFPQELTSPEESDDVIKIEKNDLPF
jgi:hypothetical protein